MKSKLDWIWENYPVDGYDGGLTEEQAKDLCVEMWNEMAENVYLFKESSKLIGIFRPYADCFACEYYVKACNKCKFFMLSGGCTELKSPYRKRSDILHGMYTGFGALRKYAIEIADLFID